MVISILQNFNLLYLPNLHALNLLAQIFVFRPISMKFGIQGPYDVWNTMVISEIEKNENLLDPPKNLLAMLKSLFMVRFR